MLLYSLLSFSYWLHLLWIIAKFRKKLYFLRRKMSQNCNRLIEVRLLQFSTNLLHSIYNYRFIVTLNLLTVNYLIYDTLFLLFHVLLDRKPLFYFVLLHHSSKSIILSWLKFIIHLNDFLGDFTTFQDRLFCDFIAHWNITSVWWYSRSYHLCKRTNIYPHYR